MNCVLKHVTYSGEELIKEGKQVNDFIGSFEDSSCYTKII